MPGLWMILASLLFACMGVCVKLASSSFATGTMVFFRGLVALLLISVWIGANRRCVLTAQWRAHLYRSLSGLAALALYFYAISTLPLATAVTLSYTSTLFLALLLAVRERGRIRRVVLAALLTGLLGVAMLLGPVFKQSYWQGGLAGLAGGAMAGIAFYNLRSLGRLGEPAWRTVFYFSLCTTVGGMPWAFASEAIGGASLREVALLFGVGAFGGGAQLALTRAYSQGETLAVASLSYSTVVFSALFGIALWDEVLPGVAWAGMALIVASGVAVAFNEARPPEQRPRD